MTAPVLATLPDFLSYFAVSLLLILAYAILYTLATPHREWLLIRQNNSAAAVAFGGSLIGFVLPLASAVSHSISLLDCVVWGAVAMVAQIATFFALRLVISDLPRRIEAQEMAAALFTALTSIAVGIANAACMTY